MKSPSSGAFDRLHLVSPLERVFVSDDNSSPGCLVKLMTVMDVDLCSSNAFVSSSIIMPFALSRGRDVRRIYGLVRKSCDFHHSRARLLWCSRLHPRARSMIRVTTKIQRIE